MTRDCDTIQAHLVQAKKQREHGRGHPLWWIWHDEVQRLTAELAAIQAEKDAPK